MTSATTIGAAALQAGRRDRHAAPCHLHCVAGSFGMGYQSQNPILGGIGGALSGLGAGASIASSMGAGAMFAGMAASVAIPVIGLAIGAVAGEAGPIPLSNDDDPGGRRMTAIITFRQRDRITLLSDASGYDAATGTLMRFVSKCQPITHLKAALAMRGSSVATSLFAANFGCVFETFDDLVQSGGRLAEHLYDNRFAMLTASGETEVDMFLAGWSDARHRMEVYTLASHDRHGSEPWQFTLQEDPVVAAPVPPADVRDAFGIAFPSDPERIDPATIGIRIMEAQRSMAFPTTLDGGGDEYHLVGGHILLTRITRESVEQRVIHRWPEDRLGEVIRPRSKAVEEPRHEIVGEVPPRFENRQQRRSWERENRRQKLHS